jgi:hypothetical protein
MPRHLLAYFLAVWAVLTGAGPATAEPAFPPGLRIGLEAPADLKPATRFPGFEDPDRNVAMVILDLPAAAYGELSRTLDTKNAKGLLDVKRESFSFQDGSGTLLTARGEANETKLHKWVLLATVPDKDITVMINVEMPETAMTVYSDAVIRKTLASIAFRPMPIQEQLGLIPFKLNDLAGFRVSRVLSAGGVILTDGPSDDIVGQPYLIISVGAGAPERTDGRAEFARNLLLSAPLRELSLQSGEPMRISGQPGFEIRAQAKAPGDEPLSVVQWVRFAGVGFLRIIGVTPKNDWDAMFNRFRAVRDGIEPR